MSNKIKSGRNAGASTRKVINKGTGAVADVAQSAATAVAGFFTGLFLGEAPAPVAKKPVAKVLTKTVAKTKAVAKPKVSTKSN